MTDKHGSLTRLVKVTRVLAISEMNGTPVQWSMDQIVMISAGK